MFPLRLRSKKEDPVGCARSRKSGKWSINKGFCQGTPDKLKATTTEESFDDVTIHERLQEEQKYSLTDEDTKITRVVNVVLERDQQGLGMCLISGPPNQTGHCPLVITNIKPNGPADREGTIKVGDRLLSIDGHRLTGLTVREAERLLLAPNGGRPVWLSIEYDVSVMAGVRAGGPVLVSSPPHTDLGLTLVDSRSGVIVSGVRPASLAERTGAFLPGDQILAVDECRIENRQVSAAEVFDLIVNTSSNPLQIEVLPVAAVNQGYSDSFRCSLTDPIQEPDFNDNIGEIQFNTLGKLDLEDDTPDLRIESGSVILNTSPGVGYGLLLRRAPSKRGAVVCYMEPFGIADRSGVLQIGDRILTVNGKPAEKFDRLEDLATLTVVLTVQFDVEVHSPLDGPLPVTLTRSEASGFGITVGYDKNRKDVLITNIKWGSVAHRCGWLSVGDQLLGINGINVKGDLAAATEIADSAGSTVTFVVHKMSLDQGYSSPGLPSNSSGVDSWGSNNEDAAFQNDFQIPDFRETWKTEMNNSTNSFVSQQSDDETYSSMRLSESVLDALASGKQNGLPIKPPSPPCPLQTNYKTRKVNLPSHWRGSSNLIDHSMNTVESEEIVEPPHFNTPVTFRTFHGSQKDEDYMNLPSTPTSSQPAIFKVTLSKSKIFEDFGFSVSDGLYEKGVFINSIKPGSPADLSKMLQTYDKIIQVNDVPTHNLDCVMAVPLIASAETLTLTILRYDKKNSADDKTGQLKIQSDLWSDLEEGAASISKISIPDSTKNYKT